MKKLSSEAIALSVSFIVLCISTMLIISGTYSSMDVFCVELIAEFVSLTMCSVLSQEVL